MVKLLIVDDSVFMRTVIRDMVTKDPTIEVVGTASNGVDALEKIQNLEPDLVTLDIEMPKMNGIQVLEELKRQRKRPKILMLSTLTSEGAEMTTRAIRLGADDFMLKPKDIPHVRVIGDELVTKLKHLVTLPALPAVHRASPTTGPASHVVLIGSSAGGPPMLDTLLAAIPQDIPAGIVVTQHMPIGFTAALAERFNRIASLPVKETENGDIVENGKILLSKAGVHTIISNDMDANKTRLGKIIHSNTAPLHGVRPAVDKTFESAAKVYGKNIVSVILSGMGNDAGAGAQAIKEAGGTSLLCDEKDCLVYGMARSAIQKNAVDKVLPLAKLAPEIERLVHQMEAANV
ncbi:chemotaxis-specific protein-glutamate methyltransferase CheB [Methanoregula formicica]|uniref:Protein-glutamate methylesterase/protein-glutamine glutaminase n=1 Tax=Methanoregula formicica (strain DSM 22288 / NBRC 105244 / SMSP) TaxID=593750 RepID=L0HFH7_METFS|nr:chemotaxis-specific protein-glutamate methyltransferase CheB [Methanoregula formicica]AGB02551.1 chemotaxis response regulator containing a CheY-like receiver domain and a methylesterase domain [Methanoregula formicica SMSP]